MSNVEVIRDLTESLIAQFIENDSLQKYQNVTKVQTANYALECYHFLLESSTGSG
jgi:hypothetical protein